MSSTRGIASLAKAGVVVEVEKIQKGRDERRQKQVETKLAYENSIDHGNPHWEFSKMIREYRQGLDSAQPKETRVRPNQNNQITVCVRKRPLSKKDVGRKEIDVITVSNQNQISVHECKTKVDLTKFLDNQHFRFDYAFDESSTNDTVYRYSAKPLVRTIFDGGMATCFAYGQTGSGKTHTMGGYFDANAKQCVPGIYALAARDVFDLIKSFPHLTVGCSFFEIYGGKVFDLLDPKGPLRVLQDKKQQVQVVGLTERVVHSVDDVLGLIKIGNRARASGKTTANNNSSRSHAVFQIILRNGPKLHGKFSLIDLAGNERGADTSKSDRQTRLEGAEINKSLLALKECIRALGREGAHLPFRESKLTMILRDSFVGEKSKTCMISMISPGISSCEHTLNTLRYADRVKELAPTDPMLKSAISIPMVKSSIPIPMAAIMEDEIKETENETELEPLEVLEDSNEAETETSEFSELVKFTEAVPDFRKTKDDMFELHKCFLEENSAWAVKNISLLKLKKEFNWSQELYASKLNVLLDEKINMVNDVKGKIQQLHESAKAEESEK